MSDQPVTMDKHGTARYAGQRLVARRIERAVQRERQRKARTRAWRGLFAGDGRRRMRSPLVAPYGTHPVTLTRAQARDLVERTLEKWDAQRRQALSWHTAEGGTVWVLAEFAREHGLHCTVCKYLDVDHTCFGYGVTLSGRRPW